MYVYNWLYVFTVIATRARHLCMVRVYFISWVKGFSISVLRPPHRKVLDTTNLLNKCAIQWDYHQLSKEINKTPVIE